LIAEARDQRDARFVVVRCGVEDVAADALREVRLVEIPVMERALQRGIDGIGGQALELEDWVVHRASRAGFGGSSHSVRSASARVRWRRSSSSGALSALLAPHDLHE